MEHMLHHSFGSTRYLIGTYHAVSISTSLPSRALGIYGWYCFGQYFYRQNCVDAILIDSFWRKNHTNAVQWKCGDSLHSTLLASHFQWLKEMKQYQIDTLQLKQLGWNSSWHTTACFIFQQTQQRDSTTCSCIHYYVQVNMVALSVVILVSQHLTWHMSNLICKRKVP